MIESLRQAGPVAARVFAPQPPPAVISKSLSKNVFAPPIDSVGL
jgi:hypothetical protein